MAAYVWLVYPGTCQVETGRKLTGRILDIRARTGGEAISRSALQHHILDAPLLAELALGFAAAVCIHHKDVGLHDVDGRNKVHNAITSIDIGILYIFNRLHHKEALLLGIKRLMMLVAENRLVGSDTYVEVAVLRRLAEKLNVAAMQQVITTTYKNFFHNFKLLFLFRTNYQIKDRFAVFCLQNYNKYSKLARKNCTNITFCVQYIVICAFFLRNIWVKDKKMVLLPTCLLPNQGFELRTLTT